MILCKETNKKVMACECCVCSHANKERVDRDGIVDCVFPHTIKVDKNQQRDYGRRKGGKDARSIS
jgi:hypothetical protein